MNEGFTPLSLRSLKRCLAPFVDARGPRARFMIALLMECSKLVPGSMRRLANQFQHEGDYPHAMQCWQMVRRAAPFDSVVLVSYLSCALDADDLTRVRELYRQVRGQLHIPPSRLVWLATELAERGDWEFAATVLSDWQSVVGDAASACARMPSMVTPLIGPDVADLAQCLESFGDGSVDQEVMLELARLCFAFGHPEVAARLYRKAELMAGDAWLDRVAMRYGDACAAQGNMTAGVSGELDALAVQASGHPDALMSLAYVALVTGQTERAWTWAEKALRFKYAGSGNLPGVLDDARVVWETLAALRLRSLDLPDAVLERIEQPVDPVPKRFVCGFGWTGSGAVYDAIRGHAGFVEFEGAGEDDVLNADSETEATFIQSRAGLGELWTKARWGESITWQTLWDVFRCHVVGVCAIGYSEYKGAVAAANHVHKYGTQYTGIFRKFFEGFAALLDAPRRGGLHALLIRTTEALCCMLLNHTQAGVVLFNNAVFGRNAIMLEIFAGYRAAIVYRDPLDVYADRIRSDKNHWRTPRQMAEFYDHGLSRYLAYKAKAPASTAAALREVPFERFVQDADFRERVKTWLLDGVKPTAEHEYFDPQISRRNIGIHRQALDDADRGQLRHVVDTCRRMNQQADISWFSAGERT